MDASVSPTVPRVLIVDDYGDTADLMALLLEDLGFSTSVAYGGEQALARAEQLHPDTVILDIDMPGMSGLETSKRIRSAPWGASTRIVVMSGWVDDRHVQAARDAGCNVFLAKPARMEDVLGAVRGELSIAGVGFKCPGQMAQKPEASS